MMEGGIQERTFTFKITGYTPLLMHNPASMGRSGGAKVKRIPSAEEEAEAGLYVDANGKLYLKFVAFRNCCLGGSRGMKIGKDTAYAFLAGTFLNVDLDQPCYLMGNKTGQQLTSTLDGDGQPKDYEIDTRRAVVQKQGIQRSRPKVRDWAASVSFLVDISGVTKPEEYAELVHRCLNRGGQFRGVGDYRPEKGGPFGRFTAELVNGTAVPTVKGKK